MADGCCILRCLTILIITLAICVFNMLFCMALSVFVDMTIESVDLTIICMVVPFLWHLGCIIRSFIKCRDESELKTNCRFSCTSVMVLLAVSFTQITRYCYFERWPRYPEEREGVFSFLLVHKVGLISLVSGIPVMYGCKFQHLINDKKMIYKVVADFIDIYEMAELLSMSAPSCTPLHSSNAYNITMNKDLYNNTRYAEQQFNCTESTFSALKKGGSLEIVVQVFCSFSFLIFYMIYREALNESKNSRDSLRKYVRFTLLLQDIPFLVIRIWVWILYGFETDQFIFLMKNGLSTSLTLLGFCECCFSSDEADEENQSSQPPILGPQRNERETRIAWDLRSQTNPGFDCNH